MTFERLFYGVAAALTTLCMGLLVYVGDGTIKEVAETRLAMKKLEKVVASMNIELVKVQILLSQKPPPDLLLRVSNLEDSVQHLEEVSHDPRVSVR